MKSKLAYSAESFKMIAMIKNGNNFDVKSVVRQTVNRKIMASSMFCFRS